jgi:hypothetical protein
MATGNAAVVRHVRRSILRAAAGRSKLGMDALFLQGLSSRAERHLLNNLCARPGTNYLEIGTLLGATAVAASYGNQGRFTSVDNFSEFGVFGARDNLAEVRRHFSGRCRFRFLEADCWTAALRRRVPRGVNVYFYDGPHSEEDQYRAFTHFDPVLADPFVAVIDDWNWTRVRHGTWRAFEELGYRVLYKREFFTPRMRSRWWNGLLVAVVAKRPRRPALKAAPAGGRPRKAGRARARSTRPGAAGRSRAPRRRTGPGRTRPAARPSRAAPRRAARR